MHVIIRWEALDSIIDFVVAIKGCSGLRRAPESERGVVYSYLVHQPNMASLASSVVCNRLRQFSLN